LKAEITKLAEYAAARVITKDEDAAPANDDLSLISKLRKAIKEKQAEYCDPIKLNLDAVKGVFTDLLDMLEKAYETNRTKLTNYHNIQVARQKEADELNRQAEELARKQAEFSGTGEFTVNTTPVEAPPPIHKVASSMGTSSFKANWTWRLVDINKVPRDHMILDSGKIGKEVKSGLRDKIEKDANGVEVRTPAIPGIEIYCEDILANRAR
jgi:hypothetical protein